MANETFVAATGEDFAGLLDGFFNSQKSLDRCLVRGRVVSIEDDGVLVEVYGVGAGYIAEGRIPLREFTAMQEDVPEIGAELDVYVERFDGHDGALSLSYEQAKREKVWNELEEAFENKTFVSGTIVTKVSGGLTVSLQGVPAFLPGSHVDIRRVKDLTPYIGTTQKFLILRIDRARNNIVLSRRQVVEASRSDERSKVFSTLKEGQVIRGKVKNIADYGAFVDLGGVDGLLHLSDMSWSRVSDPREIVSVDQELDVYVIRFSEDGRRISLGLKQLNDPWKDAKDKFPIGTRVSGVVRNIVDYGAFVEVGEGIEGLVHASEMSWQRGNINPHNILKVGQEVSAVVLDLDPSCQRLSLGIKQCEENPWNKAQHKYAEGQVHSVKVMELDPPFLKVVMQDGAFGVVHQNDIAFDGDPAENLQKQKVGDMVPAFLLRFDHERERFIFGFKQASLGDMGCALGEVVTCEVTAVKKDRLEVVFGPKRAPGSIRRAELALSKQDQNPSSFAAGEKIDAKLFSLDGGPQLSIRLRDREEQKEMRERYGSTQSGATLGEILGSDSKARITEQAEKENK